MPGRPARRSRGRRDAAGRRAPRLGAPHRSCEGLCGRAGIELRAGEPPIVARVAGDFVWIDVRAFLPGDDETVAERLDALIGGDGAGESGLAGPGRRRDLRGVKRARGPRLSSSRSPRRSSRARRARRSAPRTWRRSGFHPVSRFPCTRTTFREPLARAVAGGNRVRGDPRGRQRQRLRGRGRRTGRHGGSGRDDRPRSPATERRRVARRVALRRGSQPIVRYAAIDRFVTSGQQDDPPLAVASRHASRHRPSRMARRTSASDRTALSGLEHPVTPATPRRRSRGSRA